MAIQRDDKDEPDTRLDGLIEQFRAAEKRALLKRGIAVWTQTEALLGIVPPGVLLPNKLN